MTLRDRLRVHSCVPVFDSEQDVPADAMTVRQVGMKRWNIPEIATQGASLHVIWAVSPRAPYRPRRFIDRHTYANSNAPSIPRETHTWRDEERRPKRASRQCPHVNLVNNELCKTGYTPDTVSRWAAHIQVTSMLQHAHALATSSRDRRAGKHAPRHTRARLRCCTSESCTERDADDSWRQATLQGQHASDGLHLLA